jgi:hypothetical protein
MVSFRHPTLQYLFAAKLMLDDAHFDRMIRKDPLAYRPIIIHAAALRRNDRKLLIQVGEKTRETLSKVLMTVDGSKLESLVDVGFESAGAASLKDRLKRTAPLPPDVLEAQLDELYERTGNVPSPEPTYRENQEGLGNASIAVDLLSRVVVASELVDDVDLRVELLKAAIEDWSVCGLALLQQERQSGQISDLVRRTLKDMDSDKANLQIDKIVRLTVIFVLAIQVVGTLAAKQTRDLLDRLLGDKEFMATAIYAFLTVFLACVLKLRNWPQHLVKLYRDHSDHPFVRDGAVNLAMSFYQSPSTADAEAAVLLPMLVDAIHPQKRGGARVAGEREAARNATEQELRKNRARAKLFGRADISLFEGQDDESSSTPDESSAHTASA